MHGFSCMTIKGGGGGWQIKSRGAQGEEGAGGVVGQRERGRGGRGSFLLQSPLALIPPRVRSDFARLYVCFLFCNVHA